MVEVRTFFWSRFAVLGLLISTAALAVVGVVAAYLELPADQAEAVRAICVVAFAAVAGFALAVAQAAAALLPTLKGREARAAGFWIAVFCAVLTGLVSLVGVWLGHGVLSGHVATIDEGLVIAGGLGLAFVKPAMSYAIAEAQAADLDDLRAAEARQDERLDRAGAEDRAHRHAENLRRIELQGDAPGAAARTVPKLPGPTPHPTPKGGGGSVQGTRPKHLKMVGNAALAGALGLTAMAAGSDAEAVPISAPTEPTARTEPAGPSVDNSAQRAQARMLIARGLSPVEVHRATGVPHGSCKRMAWEFRQGKWAA